MKWDGRLPIGFNIPNILQNLWVNRWPEGCGLHARQTPEPIRRRPTLLASPETLGQRTRQAASNVFSWR